MVTVVGFSRGRGENSSAGFHKQNESYNVTRNRINRVDGAVAPNAEVLEALLQNYDTMGRDA